MQTKRWIAVSIITLAVVGGLLGFTLPARLQLHLAAPSVHLLSFSLASAMLILGSSVLFLFGLGRFTDQLKRAYRVFCIGLVFFAISMLQVPAASFVQAHGSQWLWSLQLLLPILLGIAGIYAGVKLFAGLFGVGGVWSKPWLVTALALAAAGGAYYLPARAGGTSITNAHGTSAMLACSFVLFLAAAVLLYYAQRRASAGYKQALVWFFRAMALFAGLTVCTMATILFLGGNNLVVTNGYTLLAQGIFALALLKAAYEFNLIGVTVAAVPKERVGTIDIVVAAAQKVSDVRAVDAHLDTMRSITATLQPGQLPTPQQDAQLQHTYQDLEQYLVNQDPVRRYTKAELRQNIREELHLTGPVFFDTMQ